MTSQAEIADQRQLSIRIDPTSMVDLLTVLTFSSLWWASDARPLSE
ncbi:hypothetical protein [Gordonia cholesterolivorans]